MDAAKTLAKMIFSGVLGAALTASIFLGCLVDPTWHVATFTISVVILLLIGAQGKILNP